MKILQNLCLLGGIKCVSISNENEVLAIDNNLGGDGSNYVRKRVDFPLNKSYGPYYMTNFNFF